MSILLIQACFYFSCKIIEKYRLQGTSGGHCSVLALLKLQHHENTQIRFLLRDRAYF